LYRAVTKSQTLMTTEKEKKTSIINKYIKISNIFKILLIIRIKNDIILNYEKN